MKTRVVLTIVPLIATAFLVAGPAQAQQPIPSITQTGQWRALKAYVNQLETKRNTPATAQQKTTFRQRLNAKQTAANDRVKKLYSQRLQRVINRDTAKERKQIQKLQDSANRQVGQLANQRSSRIATEKATFASRISQIRSRYAGALAADSRQLKRLQRNLRRTTDPFQRQIILSHIETVQRGMTRLKQARTKDINGATGLHQQKVAAIREKFAGKIASTRAYYKGLIDQVRAAWKTIYADDVAAAKSVRTKQFRLVTNLRNRGAGYIDQMPTPPA